MHVIIDFNCLSSCLSCYKRFPWFSVNQCNQWEYMSHGSHGLTQIRGIYTQFADSTILHESTSKFRG